MADHLADTTVPHYGRTFITREIRTILATKWNARPELPEVRLPDWNAWRLTRPHRRQRTNVNVNSTSTQKWSVQLCSATRERETNHEMTWKGTESAEEAITQQKSLCCTVNLNSFQRIRGDKSTQTRAPKFPNLLKKRLTARGGRSAVEWAWGNGLTVK